MKTDSRWCRWSALGAFLLAVTTFGPALAEEVEEAEGPPVKQIRMVAENWKWTPNVIRVKKGTKIVIDFKSYDASHSFVLKALNVKVALPEGKKGHVEFVADEVGKFKWRCGRPCGDGCAKMTGQLIVEE